MSNRKRGSGQGGNSEIGGITTITIRTYVTAFVVLIALMVAALVLTRVLPAGEFDRIIVDGSEVIVAGSFHYVEGDLPLWEWLLSPLLILGGPNNVVLISLLVFLFVIGGAFFALESCGMLTYLIASVARRFESNKRLLLFVLPLVFMLMGTMIGSFEEAIPLTAIVVALSLRLGWDRFMGLGMSLLAVGCGFAVGVMNPFTTGIAQSLAGLPIFSGASLRIVAFILVYALLMAFLVFNARRIERATVSAGSMPTGSVSTQSASIEAKFDSGSETASNGEGYSESYSGNEVLPGDSSLDIEQLESPQMRQALKAFVIIFGIGITAIIACSVIPVSGLSDLVFPLCALTFLLCGIIAPLLSGCTPKQLGAWFLGGMKAIAPGALLVLMASSISFMLTEGRVLDTVIFYASDFLMDKPAWLALLGIYGLVLLLEFAVPSGSAKAFLLIPLIAPLVDLIDIPRQLAVVAYIFGDGFSNVFYPTNPALLIALSICGVSFGEWIRRTLPFIFGLLITTSAILVIGLAIGYQ